MNKCILVGNLTRDPETSTTGSGITLCRMTVAVDREYQNANGERETDFLSVTAWRKLAENCGKYLVKGSKVAVCGSIQTRTYEVDGQKRYATDIIADNVEFLTRGGASAANSGAPERDGSASGKKPVSELKPIEDEGLPF